MTRFLSVMAVAFLLLCVSQRAMADCVSPDAPAGAILYNQDQNVPQVCAGAVWTALGPPNPSATGTACTGPDRVEGTILYNTDHKVLQYCNGANWIAVDNTSQSDVKGEGYFVLSETKWRSNLGNLAGADAKCLTELTTKNWAGKTEAQARGLLVADKVKAFLCNSTTCNNAQPLTVYSYARAGVTPDGHSVFKTDANGAGPGGAGSTYYWDDPWTFGVDEYYWTNRSTTSATRWGTTPKQTTAATTCTDFTTLSGSQRAHQGRLGGGDATRWDSSSGLVYCDNAAEAGRLICMVHP